MKRKRLNKKSSNRNFKKGLGTNKKNLPKRATRGGYRL